MAARRGLSVKERRRLRGRERIILKVENSTQSRGNSTSTRTLVKRRKER